jgi:hypothetical protein
MCRKIEEAADSAKYYAVIVSLCGALLLLERLSFGAAT